MPPCLHTYMYEKPFISITVLLLRKKQRVGYTVWLLVRVLSLNSQSYLSFLFHHSLNDHNSLFIHCGRLALTALTSYVLKAFKLDWPQIRVVQK